MNDQIIQNIKLDWSDLLENLEYDEVEAPVLDTNTLSALAERNKIVINVFNVRKLETEYVSPNVIDVLGYSQEESLSNTMYNFFERIPKDHINYTFNTKKIFEEILSEEQNKDITLLKSTVTGIKFNHPEGTIRLLIRYFKLSNHANDVKLGRFIFTVQNITHLLKNDIYFIRVVYKNSHGEVKLKLYHSETHEITNHDIISQRELDVVKLIAQGKETDEIAKALSISRNTVNNHRQRMFDRLGAKDTTALVQLAQLSEII